MALDEFENRGRALERKFALESEHDFKAASRTAHLFGLWAADKMGLSGDKAESYAQALVDAIVAKPGHEHLVAAVEKDLRAKGVAVSHHFLEKEFEALHAVAMAQIPA